MIEIYVIKQQKKLKVTAMQDILLRIKSKNYKREMGQWIDDNKSVSVREDLAYNLICYINTLVIKTDEFKNKNGITNNQSARREIDIIVTIMKVFTEENMVRH